ncbi:multidrug transporter AcrB [Emticicia aquatilis]|uniref:Multidrug transporter AcrB n=1 Tax=Emticicia aquatilis TaxID=1537369 RepID=A0A916Z745_9BACT|nr:efflux RND transporter permease subunit [Emticicia aquatilis]GGD79782.1 multidrug transporter AcrB [Emticicia aquatilis]
MNLTNFSVKNYQFTLVMFLMIAVVGVVTLLTMPRAEDPQINPPTYPIIVIYPGTSPKDLEELVVKPIENEIYELENIDKITTEIQDGFCVIKAEFKYGLNVDNKYQEVVREVNALRSELPSDIYSIEVNKVDPSDVNIVQIALVSENASFKTLKYHAENLKDQLEKVSSLKKVKVAGVPEEVVRIDVRIDKLAELKIPLNLVIGSLQSEAINIPGGSVTAGTKTFNVKTSGKFKNIEDIANTVIFNGNGKIIFLKDIATIGFKNEEEKHITRINGHRCVLVSAAQKVGANISTTQNNYLPIVAEYEKNLPENIKLIKNFDQADNVAQRLSGLEIDFLIAILLVLVTLLPLGFRASIIVMIAIPLSVALGLVGLNAFGFSLNQLSIVGLVVALGLLVDDSIVVVENIERWLRDGYSPKEAAIKATKQISLAVIGCTATLAISFLPMIFLPGGPGEFIRGLPMAVITSVLASLVVSLTVVPFLASRLLKNHANAEGNIFLRLLKKGISSSYSKLMTFALKRPIITLLVAFGLFGASATLFPVIGFKLFPTSEKPIFLINIRLPLQTSLQENNRITKMVEDSLKQNKAIVYFTSNIGKGNPPIYYNVPQQQEKNDFSQVFVQLDSHAKPTEKKILINELRQQFASFPYAKVEVNDFEQGPPIEAPISIRVFGDNLDTLRKLSYEVEQIVKANAGTIYVNNDLNVLKTDIKVNINREKARTLGVLTADIDKTVRLVVAGLQLGNYSNDDGDDFKVIIDAPREKFATLDVFNNLFVNNAVGVPIPLNQIAEVSFETSSTTVNHFNKNRFIKITSSTKKNVLANTVLKEIVPKLDKIKMPKGYFYKLSGEAESEGDAFGGGFITVILLTVFLFIAVLILQFKNFKGTLIVLSVIPLGVVGGVTMLWLTGNPMSFIAIIGFIGLAGIEVKNSILLVDFTNQLRAEGMELNKAIEQAGEIRFLPVVLTSLTAIGGLIPLALNPNPQISPLALVLIGGLLSSTILSRIVTPVMYKIIPPKIEKDED